MLEEVWIGITSTLNFLLPTPILGVNNAHPEVAHIPMGYLGVLSFTHLKFSLDHLPLVGCLRLELKFCFML